MGMVEPQDPTAVTGAAATRHGSPPRNSPSGSAQHLGWEGPTRSRLLPNASRPGLVSEEADQFRRSRLQSTVVELAMSLYSVADGLTYSGHATLPQYLRLTGTATTVRV